MNFKKFTPVFCLMAYTAVTTHLLLLFYQLSGSDEIKTLKSNFNEHQMKIYKEIQQERRTHYIFGILLGISIAILYDIFFPVFNPICTYIGIATMIAQNFYLLMPNSKWTIEYLDNPQDVYNWNKVYKKFRYLSAYGSLLGLIFFTFGNI